MTAPSCDRPLAAYRLEGIGGIGPVTRRKLAGLGITTLQEVVFHLPLRYEDRTRRTPIALLENSTTALIEGEITQVSPLPGNRLNLKLSDQSGSVSLRFFHLHYSLRPALRLGAHLRCYGPVSLFQGQLQMTHPEIRVLSGHAPPPLDDRLTPIYPTVAGLHQGIWRKLIFHALEQIRRTPACLPELLPEGVDVAREMSLADALQTVHLPTPETDWNALLAGQHPAMKRLAFEELLAHRLSLRLVRESYHRSNRAPRLTLPEPLAQRFRAHLPFSLTSAQERVWQEIAADLARETPMLRLLQGDVGSGKTVIATLTALTAAARGYQAALMAPTELLAEQHVQVLRKSLSPLGIAVAWLVGSMKESEKKAVLTEIAAGAVPIVVGTHALFQAGVDFARLGAVIVDEQHRFGVAQRLALKNKGEDGATTPHQLIMTATPIPRSLAMIGYADLDSSVIDALPPGRQPITTVVFPNDRRTDIIARVKRQCAQGRQAYWVCTIIEENEQLSRQAAETLAAELQQALAPLKVELLHGRQKSSEKEARMAAFKARAIDVLVATTVIEVGVDVPNASLMIIENAECLGLAQLHQLRGRVGRGSRDSYCVLLYQAPLSETARARLSTLRQTQDGFVIARKDLELRGPGDVLGTRQTGAIEFRIADIGRDQWMLDQVMACAERLLEVAPGHAQQLVERWLGVRHHYAGV